MQIADTIFLYAAEEKSISRAAARAFVSQQCASKHIQNLEARYGVPLIKRRPVFALTEAGEALFCTLQQIHMLELETSLHIRGLWQGSEGSLSIGVNADRARLLLPAVLREYKAVYPQVQISVRSEDTAALTQLLLQGEVNLIVGINSAAEPRFHITPLLEESIYFVAARELVKAYAPECEKEKSISLKQISRFPLCRNAPSSTLTGLLNRCAAKHNISLRSDFVGSNYGLQFALCRAGLAGFFCPKTLLEPDSSAQLCVFEVPEVGEKLHIHCIRPAGSVQPAYLTEFENSLRRVYKKWSVLPIFC